MRTAQEIIRREYGTGGNFMTPRVIEYGFVRKSVAYELSEGDWFDYKTSASGERVRVGIKTYGVSVAGYDFKVGKPVERSDESAGCFTSIEAAREHIKSLGD